MSGLGLAGLGIALMLSAIALRVPIAAAMGLAGFFGTWAVLGRPDAVLNQLKTLSYDSFASHSLSIVPMFLLMGQIASRSGMSAALFRAAAALIGHRSGGLAMAAVGASAGFGAICGSSLATASTMGQVALPELRARGYGEGLATGVLAAGGTLGILIPPSIVLVIYAVLTEQNIVKMFAAALVPGLLAVVGYALAVRWAVWRRPESAPPTPPLPWRARLRASREVWPVVAIFALVMGGIVGDWNWAREGVQALFTPTEGAAFGVIATALAAQAQGGMTAAGWRDAVLETATATALIFAILLGAQVFNGFLALTRAPQTIAEAIAGSGIAPLLVLSAMLVIYLILGCVMDSLSMILLTIPVFFPVIASLDFGLGPEATAIWFGILALIVVEVGLITPPVGLNLFIINRLAGDVPLGATYRGVAPFIVADLARVVLLVAFPGLSLWLVGLLA